MKKLLAVVASLALFPACNLGAQQANRIDLRLDSSEADTVLTILDLRAARKTVTDADWQTLFSTIPYQRLKKRESSMRRDFTDVEFKRFVATLDSRRGELRQTLAAWEKTDLVAAAHRPLLYLPDDATLHAAVYPVIKPQTNSFVFETNTDPAIFLYLDPKISSGQFENTVAHELHHIGLSSLDAQYEQRIQALPENARKAARWMGAFGEGVAVLAAAGSLDVAPLSAYPQRDQIDWDLQMERVGAQLQEVNQFFIDTIRGDLRNDAAAHEGSTFFGYRGPWYAVGYLMAATIEKQLGRATLVETLKDPRDFVARYNEAASARNAKGGEKVPLFSSEIVEAVTRR
jgi:hypothetical protein